MSALPAVENAGEQFLESLKTGDYQMAYAQLHPALQQKIGTPQELRRMVESGKMQPNEYRFTYVSADEDKNQGHLVGNVTMHGVEGTVTLDLAKSGGQWKVLGFDLEPK